MTTFRFLLVRAGAFVALCLAACEGTLSELQPSADSIRVKDVVDLQRVGDTLAILTRVDSAITLVAYLPAAATVRSVAFTTSAGYFVLTGGKEATVRVETDTLDARKRWAARISIRKDTSAFAIISATVATYRDTVRVRFR